MESAFDLVSIALLKLCSKQFQNKKKIKKLIHIDNVHECTSHMGGSVPYPA